ncbi:MAG TPA: DinB family protein [Thermoanaerobaculia bacterium]|nr:DinB family protein [Thermoanaerobaculia bacterium]
MSRPPLTYRRVTSAEEVLTALNILDNAARHLADEVDQRSLDWQPAGGKGWSIGQCLDHLVKTNEVYGGAILAALQEARHQGRAPAGAAPFRPGFFARWFLGQIEPPPKRKLSASRLAKPGSAQPKDGLVAAYLAGHERLRRGLAEARGLDLNALRFKNPFAPLPWTVATGLTLIVAHDHRHLEQAERVRRSPGFPASAGS